MCLLRQLFHTSVSVYVFVNRDGSLKEVFLKGKSQRGKTDGQRQHQWSNIAKYTDKFSQTKRLVKDRSQLFWTKDVLKQTSKQTEYSVVFNLISCVM